MSRRVYGMIVSIILIFILSFSYSTVKAASIESNPNWNIHFENVQIVEGSITARTLPTIDKSLTEITYGIDLDTPGQFYEFTVDVKNTGSMNAILEDVLSTTLTTEQQRYLLYSVTYSDGTKITKNDKLDAGETKSIRVRVEFKKDISAEDLPSEDTVLELTLDLRYVQADPDKPDEPTPDKPDEPTKPDKPDDNGGSTDNKDKTKNNSSGAQTGDKIIISFAVIAVAIIVLILVRRRKDDDKDSK